MKRIPYYGAYDGSMKPEQRMTRFVRGLERRDIPEDVAAVVRQVLLTVAGTMIAGAREDGCEALRGLLATQGGKPEATVAIYGDKLPASAAALLNGVMGRALDFCDAMAPGLHIGSSLIPAAFAATELAGGCDGGKFLTALTVGAEIASRMNGGEADYDGFDPTGVAGVFGATAAAARILDLDEEQTLHALALAFNRCGGSFQSNVDGSLAVRLIQGWVAESGVQCARLAKAGITGPANFLTGVYGYMHLYSSGARTAGELFEELGQDWALKNIVFKRYPSCGCTQAATDLALSMLAATGITIDKVAAIRIRLPSYAYKLVGTPFTLGGNPRVNAQFSVQYCTASALIRGRSLLQDFCPGTVAEAGVVAVAERIMVIEAPEMNARDHTAVELSVETRDGTIHTRDMEIAPGFPGNPLGEDEHLSRFKDCLQYAPIKLPPKQVEQLLSAIRDVDLLPDATSLIQLLVAPRA